MKQEWMEKLRKHQKSILVGGLLIGLCLLILPSFASQESDSVTTVSAPDLAAETESYTTQLTAQLTKLLQEVKGVGQVQLFLTLDSGVEYEYLKEQTETVDTKAEDQSRDYSETYLYVQDESGNQRLLAVKRVLPKIKGAAVVCDGGADPAVEQQIIALLRTALDLSAANISVSPLA